MSECAKCGDEVKNKNSAGYYREKCCECMRAVADARTPHHEQCNDADCIICRSYWKEQNGC